MGPDFGSAKATFIGKMRRWVRGSVLRKRVASSAPRNDHSSTCHQWARLSIPLDAGEGFDRPAASLIGAADNPASCHEDVVSN
jgi:hypothetical protein